MDTKEELRAMCKDIADEIAAIAEGKAWRVDGEIVIADEEPEGDDVNLASFCDWVELRELGDMRFEIRADKSYLGGKMLVAFGGPNIWLHDDRVCGYWGWSNEVVWRLSSDAKEIVDDFFREEWESVR